MALHLPPSVSINNLVGGYNSNYNYTNLADNQTNLAQNVEITTKGSIKERNGYVRRNPSRIVNSTSANVLANGEPITGYFQLAKLGILASTTEIKSEIVGAGDSLYKYTADSATAIATGLTDNSQVYWQFAQIQDPRSATNDVVVMTNGRDSIKIWDGEEASAVDLDSITSATQVPVAKFIATLQNRLYALNIEDNTDIDSKVKVMVSTFDENTGVTRPQRFNQSFYVGGSDKYGEITGHAILNDQLIIFKKRATYKFIPGSGRLIDTAGLIQMDESIGCIAPGSIATIGNVVLFLSQNGMYAFDGGNFVKISDPINKDMENVNKSILKFSVGMYNHNKNQYWLALPTPSSNHNDKVLVYNIDRKVWHPPYENINAYSIAMYREENNDDPIIIFGDHQGYLYKGDIGSADGLAVGYKGFIDTVAGISYTDDDANFEITGDGLAGFNMILVDRAGTDRSKLIASNTSKTITLASAFDTAPTSADRYVICSIDSNYRTKDFDFGFADVDKKFRQVTVRASEQGDVDLKMQYIIDFKILSRAGSATMDLIADGLVWDVGVWDAEYWDGSDNVINKVNLRPLNTQGLIGKYLALRFANSYPNQPWEIFGFDILLKQVGRRRY